MINRKLSRPAYDQFMKENGLLEEDQTKTYTDHEIK